MATPLKMKISKKFQSDSKVRYNSAHSDITTESFQSFNAFLKNLHADPPTIKNQQETRQINKNNLRQISKKQIWDTLSNFITDHSLGLFLVICAAFILGTWDFTVRSFTDQQCWNEFKRLNCQFQSKALECLKLLTCISDENFQFTILKLVLVLTITSSFLYFYTEKIVRFGYLALKSLQQVRKFK